MNRSIIISCLGIMLLCSATCSETTSGDQSGEQGSVLPKSFNQLSIQWHDGGGMINRSEDITIGPDSGKWVLAMDGHQQSVTFSVSKSELDELYNTLRKNEFDRIQTRSEGQVFDRGGVTIHVEVDGKNYTVDNSGSVFIDKDWIGKWEIISTKIGKFATAKVDEKRFSCQLKLDDKILGQDQMIRLYVNDVILFNSDKQNLTDEQRTNGFAVNLLPGENQFDLHLSYVDTVHDNKKITDAWDIWEELTPATKTIVLFLTDDRQLDLRLSDH